jgi:glycine reductase
MIAAPQALHTMRKAWYIGDGLVAAHPCREAEETIMDMKGKKVIALGERDGIQGTALAECAKSAGADVVLEMTHCFV